MKLSIITINLNNLIGLQKTIKSVITQNFSNYEYIIIDGGSTDGSVKVIEHYSNSVDCWLSEPDKGIYNAMNKGLLKANGEYCLFLNSGDYLANESVLSNVFATKHKEDILYGTIINNCKDNYSEVQYPAEKHITFRHFIKSTLPHPCSFIKRDLFNKTGLYNENLSIVSDWEFFIKAICKYNVSIKRLNVIIAVYDTEGISNVTKNKAIIAKERDQVLVSNFYRFIKDYEYLEKLENALPFVFYRFLRKVKNVFLKRGTY